MFALLSTNEKSWKWISGIFVTEADADAEIQRIPHDQRHFHQKRAIGLDSFPLFIIEERDFEFGDLGTVMRRLASVVPAGDEDAIHFNVYALRSEFRPEVPGRDEMGRLLHWHVSDSTLVAPRAPVFARELSAFADNARAGA